MTVTEARTASEPNNARRAMIDSQLRTSGVNEPWVLTAMARIAREDFVPETFKSSAYIDRAIPLGNGKALASPLVHAKMLSEASPKPEDKALIVGDGDGYLAALLAPLVGALDSIRPADLAGRSRKGPYTLVVVDGAIDEIPPGLASRLADGGRVVSGIVERGVTRLVTGRKVSGYISLLPVAEIGIPVIEELRTPKGWSF